MKKTFLGTFLVLLLATAVVVSCKKKKDDATPDDTSEQVTNGSDDARVQAETDAAVNDADNSMAGYSATSGRTEILAYPYSCTSGLTVDASQRNAGILTLNYDNSTACNGRVRSGSITVQLADSTVKWKTAGCVVNITFNNYAVTRTSDNKTITFSGTKTVTNVNGGLITTLGVNDGSSLVHKMTSSGLQITFDDGTKRTWIISRTRTITQPSSGVYNISTKGDNTMTINGISTSGVALTGTTRLGSTFYSVINPSSPVVWTTSCPYAPISGTRTIEGITRSLSITYGVDSNGNTYTSSCPYGFKLNWTGLDGNAKSLVVIY